MLRTLRKCTWEEIEVGEVFAWSMNIISVKLNNNDYMDIDCDDHSVIPGKVGAIFLWANLYKLPESVQALWKTE